MSLFDETFDRDAEVPDGWAFVPTFDRRDFLKLTTTGRS